MRVVLAGGGTGGHVIPALAIATEIKTRYGGEFLFIGTARGIENRLVPAAGFTLRLIEIGALKNVSFATRLKTAFDLPHAIWMAGAMLREFKPDVVIGVGGYASGPAMLAAILQRIPTLAFEPNAVPGFANRLVARYVSAAAVHFESTAAYFRNAKVTGVPVRREFLAVGEENWGAPRLLIFGGSQGAHAINVAAMKALPELLRQMPHLRVVHQTGEQDYEEVQAAYAKLGNAAQVQRFITDMPGAFASASLLLCRSGASTVAEVAAAGRPAIFIPFPRAADDHQKRNAEAFQNAQAGVMLEEANLTPERLGALLLDLLQDPPRLRLMGQAARKLAHPEAGAEIARIAAQLARVKSAELH